MALSIVINKVSTVFSSIPIGTKVADIAVSGGTAPYTYTLATGEDSFQINGTEVQTKVVMTIANLASFSVTVTDSTSETITSSINAPSLQAAVQSIFNKPNMIYKIVDDIDLGNGVLTLPTGCTLDFQGGSFNNGVIKLNSANIKAFPVRIFNNIKFTSIDKNNKAFVEWFNAKGDSVTNDSKAFQDAINSFSNIILLDKTYVVKEVYLKNYTNIISPSKHSKLLNTGDVVSDYINKYYNCQSIFRAKDNIRIKLSGIYFEGNTYLNGIYFDSDGNNTMPGDADCIIEDCKFQGLNVPIFLQGPYRGCHITRCQSNDNNGKYAFFINGTDNVVENCISGGARYGGIYLNVNNKIIGSKVFCSNYTLAQNYESVNKVIDKYYNTTPLLYSAVVIQRKCIISGLEIQQAGGNGLYIIGDSNIVQALIDSCGWKRSENSTKESANLVLNGNNNQINISSITGSLDSNISHHVYITNDVVTSNYVNLVGVNLTSYPKVKLSNRISFSAFIVNGLHFEGVNTFDKSMLGKIVYGEAPSASTVIKNQLGIKFNSIAANSKVEYKIPISLNAYSYIEVKTPIVILKNTESDIEQKSIYNILGLTYNVAILDTSGTLVKSLISGNISSGYNLIDFAGYSGLAVTKEYIISISITNTSSEVLRINIDTPHIIMCGPAGASIPLLSNVDSKLNNPNDLITTTKGLQYVKDTTNIGVDKVFQSNSIIADTTLTGSDYRFIKVADVNIKDLERYKVMVEDESSFIFIYNENSLEVEGYNYVRDINTQIEFYIKEKTGYYKDLLIKLKANYVKFQIIRSIVGNSITTYAKNTVPTDLSSYTLLPFKMIKTVFKWSEDNKIQISNDGGTIWEDLSPKFADNIHIKGYYSTVSELPSGAADGDIYMVGPAAGTNAYNMYVKTSSGWVDNGDFTSIQAGVVQELGDSTTEVVSQAGVTKALSAKIGDSITKELVMTKIGDDYTSTYIDNLYTNYITVLINSVDFVASSTNLVIYLLDTENVAHFENINTAKGSTLTLKTDYTIAKVRFYKSFSTITTEGSINVTVTYGFKAQEDYKLKQATDDLKLDIEGINKELGLNLDTLLNFKPVNSTVISDNVYINDKEFYVKITSIDAIVTGDMILAIFFKDGTTESPYPSMPASVGAERRFSFEKEVSFFRFYKGASAISEYKTIGCIVRTGINLRTTSVSNNSYIYPILPTNNLLKDSFGVCWHFSRDSEDNYMTNGVSAMKDLNVSWVRSGIYLASYFDGTEVPSAIISKLTEKVKTVGVNYLCTIAGFVELANIENRTIVDSDCTTEKLNNYAKAIRTFVTALSAVGVNYYEIENELDLKINPSTLSESNCIAIYKAAYEAVKKANPDAIVLCSFSPVKNNITNNYNNAELGKYFDVFNYHKYPTLDTASNFIGDITNIQELSRYWGVDKKVWLTETGFSTYDNNNTQVYTEAQKAQGTIICIVSAIAFGIDKVFVYSLREVGNSLKEKNFGITNNDITAFKDSFYAYKFLISELNNAKDFRLVVRNTLTYIHYINKNNIHCSVVFSKNNETIIIPDYCKLYDYKGSLLPQGNISLTQFNPVYVKGSWIE